MMETKSKYIILEIERLLCTIKKIEAVHQVKDNKPHISPPETIGPVEIYDW